VTTHVARPTSLREVTFACFGADALAAYRRELAKGGTGD